MVRWCSRSLLAFPPVRSVLPVRAFRSLCVVLVGVILLTACGTTEETTLAGYERDPDPTVGSITLPAANRPTDAFAFKAEPGKLLMVTFGFTNCPDFCPTTLADTRLAFSELGTRAEDVDLAWVTIDPERDDAETVTQYVEAFIDGGIALRTDDQAQLLTVADAFGVTYRIGENDQGQIEVGHTTHTYLVDDTGSLILTWTFGVLAADIASDLRIMLDRISAP